MGDQGSEEGGSSDFNKGSEEGGSPDFNKGSEEGGSPDFNKGSEEGRARLSMRNATPISAAMVGSRDVY